MLIDGIRYTSVTEVQTCALPIFTRFPYEIGRLAKDIAGGLMVTLPSEKDFRNPETGPILRKYLKGRKGVDVENRMRILRLIENMTMEIGRASCRERG